MVVKLLKTSAAAALLVALLGGACGATDARTRTIVLYGFSILDNVLETEIIPAFSDSWKQATGDEVRVITSFAGSGTVVNQIVFGAPAQVAMVATELDALSIREAGLATTDWRSFNNNGVFAYSVTAIVTRGGNPKDIRSFEDLARPGIDVMYQDPTTSGGAQWAVLALYGSALRATAAAGGEDRAAEGDLLRRVSMNTGSLPESARRALTQFGLGFGDALLTYENEALLDISKGRNYEIVVPNSTIYIQPHVLIIDANVGEDDRAVVEAFVDFLWTEKAQQALVRNHFRVPNERLMAEYGDTFSSVDAPFTVDDLGGWDAATLEIIDGLWRDIQREID